MSCDPQIVEELTTLAEEIAKLPHSPACPGPPGCWCPLDWVRDLIQDRLDWLNA